MFEEIDGRVSFRSTQFGETRGKRCVQALNIGFY
jgi:hypothetical protein